MKLARRPEVARQSDGPATGSLPHAPNWLDTRQVDGNAAIARGFPAWAGVEQDGVLSQVAGNLIKSSEFHE